MTPEIESLRSRLDLKYLSRALEVHEGRNRRVYIMRNLVIKIPRNLNGVADNDWEGSISNGMTQTGNYVRYARTRLCHVDDIPVVFMERVEAATFKRVEQCIGYVPEWTNRVDSFQVGFTRRQKVAYDYGIR